MERIGRARRAVATGLGGGSKRRGCRGSSLVETVVALPVLLLVSLGAVQWALIYEAKANLEYAALMAARAGSVEHADADAIRKGLARGLLGLYSPPKNLAGAVRTLRTRVLPDVTDHTRIRILNPTVEAFDDFAEPNREGIVELPNLDLHLRPTDRGAASGLNIQDANLLKVEVLYGYELQVPLVGPLIAGLARWWQRDADARLLLADRRLPLLASAVVRLQSPARRNELMVRRDGSTPGRDLAGGGAGSGPRAGAGDPAEPGVGQSGDGRGAAGGWSPVAQRTVPYRASPAPAAERDAGGQNGGAGADPQPEVPPIVDDPGAGNFDQCRLDDTLAAVTPDQPAQQTGNPVHVVTGNKYQRETDLEPLPGVLGLRFVRHYNSRVHRWRSAGFGWRHSYDLTLTSHADGRVVVHQADGRAIAFRHDLALPRPSEVAEPAQVQEVTFRPGERNSATRLGATRIEDGTLEVLPGRYGYVWRWRNGRRLHFDADGRLQRIQAPGGARTSLSYGPKGRLVQVRDPQHRYLQLFYDRFGRLVRIADPGGLHTDYVYDVHNNLTEVHYADDTVRRYHYEDPNDLHNLTGVTDARGVRFATYAYDQHDRAVLSTHAGNVGKVTLQYQPGRTEVTDAQGRTSVYHTRLEQGVPLVARIDGPGCTACEAADQRYEYNLRYQLRAITHRDGTRVEHTYDSLGRLHAIDRVRAGKRLRQAEFRYRKSSKKVSAVLLPSIAPDRRRRVGVSYNPAGQVERVTERGFAPRPDGSYVPVVRRREYRYNASGQLIQAASPEADGASSLRLGWDRHGRLRKLDYPDGASIQFTDYDPYGRPAELKNESGEVVRIEYTARGTVRRLSTQAGAIELQWTDTDLLGRARFSGGGLIEARYDDARRLTFVGLPGASPSVPPQQWPGASSAIVASSGASKAGSLDRVRQRGGRITVRDGNGSPTTFGIDDFGRTRFQESPDAGITEYTHDAAGRVIGKRSAGGAEARFLRTPDGRLRGAEIGALRYTIDLQEGGHVVRGQRLEDRVQRTGQHTIRTITDPSGRRQRMDYHYDPTGRLSRQRLHGGQFVHYQYHSSGDRRSLSILRADPIGASAIADIVENESGKLEIRFGNGVRSKRTVSNGRLDRVEVEGVGAWNYRYGVGGRIHGIDYNDVPYHRYRYDQEGRLAFALTPAALLGYRYDQNGNRTEKVVNGIHLEYFYHQGTNQLTTMRLQDRAVDVRHDPNGAAVRLGHHTFEYNSNGQPVAVRREGRLLARYQYNASAERTRKTVYDRAGKPRSVGYIYEDGRLLAETASDGRIARQYLYLGPRPLAVLQGTDIYFVHTNHLNAPIAVTDQRKRVIWRADYLPFGDAQVHEDWDGDGKRFELNLRLPGQYEDAETGLYYNYFRYYDPASGRYLTPDPLGWAAGSNPYLYAAANPIHYVDPQGLLLFAFDGTGNTDDPEVLSEKQSTISNVVRFRDTYVAPRGEIETKQGGNFYYVTGAGEYDPYYGAAPAGDSAFGLSVPGRAYALVNRLLQYLEHIQSIGAAGTTLDLDVVGFSRGAASARVFVNTVNDMIGLSRSKRIEGWRATDVADLEPIYRELRRQWSRLGPPEIFGSVGNGRNTNPDIERAMRWVADRFQYMQDYCVHLNLRFLGLFDTVPHYGGNQANDLQDLALGIPPSVAHVAHAVALNEHRADFDGVSIHRSPDVSNAPNRVEVGFIGAHSDIGGGYGEGDLSDVTFAWLVQQAKKVDVRMDEQKIGARTWDEANNPILHDSVDVCPSELYCFRGPDRQFRYLDGSEVRQWRWDGIGIRRGEIGRFHDEQFTTLVDCLPEPSTCAIKGVDMAGDHSKVGAVAETYSQWLKTHYGLDVRIDHSRLNWEQEFSLR